MVIDRIGVRFKGNASLMRNGTKKSFKPDLNRFDDSATFLGLKKLNLNNGDLQPDKTMMSSPFGPEEEEEDGNLYEAVEFRADLTYLGPDPAPYRQRYQLKTTETTGDYSDLIHFLDVLNNAPLEELPRRLEPICDVENMLTAIAVYNLFTNLESYLGSAAEYYLYHRDDTGRFIYIH